MLRLLPEMSMPKRKRTREVTVKDVRTILRLSCAEGLSVREIADRLRIGKSSVSTYLYRAREAELAIWQALPEAYADDDVLKAALRIGRKTAGDRGVIWWSRTGRMSRPLA